MAKQSISSIISQHARERPHDPALTCGDSTLSWAELDLRTNRLARAYERLGVAPFVDDPVRDDAGKVRRSLLASERS